ncbi:hypothetical protein GQR58_002382 [Nymphon striatum]|nr:hypothetical protein GQR58_002382 [Nymphon striatum]
MYGLKSIGSNLSDYQESYQWKTTIRRQTIPYKIAYRRISFPPTDHNKGPYLLCHMRRFKKKNVLLTKRGAFVQRGARSSCLICDYVQHSFYFNAVLLLCCLLFSQTTSKVYRSPVEEDRNSNSIRHNEIQEVVQQSNQSITLLNKNVLLDPFNASSSRKADFQGRQFFDGGISGVIMINGLAILSEYLVLQDLLDQQVV